jgi:hypothetical protein
MQRLVCNNCARSNVVANAGGVDGRHLLPGDGRVVFAGVELRR